MNRTKYGNKSRASAFNGVLNYMYKHHNSYFTNTLKPFLTFQECNAICVEFLTSIESKFKEEYSSDNSEYNANRVQDRFSDFKQFLKNKFNK